MRNLRELEPRVRCLHTDGVTTKSSKSSTNSPVDHLRNSLFLFPWSNILKTHRNSTSSFRRQSRQLSGSEVSLPRRHGLGRLNTSDRRKRQHPTLINLSSHLSCLLLGRIIESLSSLNSRSLHPRLRNL